MLFLSMIQMKPGQLMNEVRAAQESITEKQRTEWGTGTTKDDRFEEQINTCRQAQTELEAQF